MKTRIVVATSLNGFIARSNLDEGFVSSRSWNGFVKECKKAGNVVQGRTAFEIGLKTNVFPLRGVQMVVVSSSAERGKYGKNVFIARSPKQALAFLKQKKFKTAVIGGGSSIYAEFVQQNLVDEMLVDVQPVLLGEGIPLFQEARFEKKLDLKKVRKLGKEEVQLLYKVKK